MNKAIGYRRVHGEHLKIDIYDVSDWEGFESLIEFVKNYYFASVISKFDGPDLRRWILECEGIKFELIHDDGFGNYFLAPTKDSETIITSISEDIDRRFQPGIEQGLGDAVGVT